tara:strand:+ start:5307 stop:5552 length:246 start_codon:yes stop_codon:yes gene_type:complete
MVWVKLIIIIFSYSFILNASNLSNEEINYFNILDLNNDGFVSLEEINQSASIIFQLIDINQDKKISLNELEDLKDILEIIK